MEKTQLLQACINGVPIPDGWKVKRRSTLFMFLLSGFIQGVDFTTVSATLWVYVNDSLANANPQLHYGLIAGGRYLAPIVFGTVVAGWLDKSRSLKRLTLCIGFLLNIGYVLYSLHFSPYLPFTGAILLGSSFILSSAIQSEALRVYSCDEVQRCVLFFIVAFGAGDTIGPLLVKPFDHVDFSVGGWHITYGNATAILSLVLNTMRIILVCFCLHDLSKEFDLKAHETQSIEFMQVRTPTLKESISFEAVYLLVQQAYTGFFTDFIGRVFPLVTSTFNYSNFVTGMCYSGASVLMMLIAVFLSSRKLNSKGVYVCGIVSLVTLLIAHAVLFSISEDASEPIKIALLSTLVFCYALAWVTDQTFIVVTLGKLFPSSVQSSVEGIRMMVHLSGSVVASLASAYLYSSFQYLFCASVPFLLLLLGVMFLRRAILSDPSIPAYVSGFEFN